MRVPEHLDAEMIYAHLEDRLGEARTRAAEAHLWRCEACRTLREECAAVLSGLEWYAGEDVEPPAGYWDGFWTRWATRLEEREEDARSDRVVPLLRAAAPQLRSLATAAAIAVIVLGWWVATLPDAPDRAPVVADAGSAATRVAETEWAEDVEMFERATIAVGSVDPLSKGIVLAGLVEER